MPYARRALDRPTPLLAGLTPTAFMQRHWQKRLLVIRHAIADFTGLASPQTLFRFAQSSQVECRLVMRTPAGWQLEHGPFKSARLRSLPERDWTLLVQGLNHHLRSADQLLRRFDFVPHARLDDVMVSLAAPGGGVGPHFDSYDVFLLQGLGQRRWDLSHQRDLKLDASAPLKLLARMRPQESHVLATGDMLYLPPRVAHDGVAVQTSGWCTTYSIGFRAPGDVETARAFAEWLADTLPDEETAIPMDPDLAATSAPGRIPSTWRRSVARAVSRLPRNADAVAEFAGCLATQVKPHIQWTIPRAPISPRSFRRALLQTGIRLAAQTRCAYDAKRLFINGESFDIVADAALWRSLADRREFRLPEGSPAAIAAMLYEWYLAGWVELPGEEKTT